MKKIVGIMLLFVMVLPIFSGYAYGASSVFETSKSIGVVSREDGSGTRGAFIELFGVEVKNDNGSKKDMTTKEAIITNQTSVMMTNVAGNKYAIGYISLGSLNNTVKAVQIEGINANNKNVKNGTYPIARPFNIATKDKLTGLAKDFISYILSAEGQDVVAKNYIAVTNNAPSYAGDKPSGKIVVAGSSSVTPVMEKLKEAYLKINPSAVIEIQASDSSAGMMATINGICDIGMASRQLKESELKQLTPKQIAIDGLAIVVHNENPLVSITKQQVRAIFMGKTQKWSEVIK